MQEQNADYAPPSRSFFPLALVTALLTLGLIVFGAVVRVTDSGLGCGNDWPLCNGTIFPPLDNVTAWIEWLHRLFALLIGLCGLGMLALAVRAYRRQNSIVLQATVVAAVLFVVQSALGAIVVLFELPPTFVTLHLGFSMLLLGALLFATVAARYRPRAHYQADQFTTLVYVNAAFSLLIILTGALVRGSGATLACIDWPLCNGEVLPLGQGMLALVHMMHRVAVLAMGISLLILVWQVFLVRDDLFTRWLAAAAFAVYLLQAGVGALFVLTAAAPEWGAAHVGLAAAVWGLLVALCVVEAMNTKQAAGQQEAEWKAQSKATSQ